MTDRRYVDEDRFPPYKPGPLPAAIPANWRPHRQPAGSLERGGYRPPPGTYARVLQDERE